MIKTKYSSLLMVFILFIFMMTAVAGSYTAFAQAPPTIVDPFADEDDTPPVLTLEEEDDTPPVLTLTSTETEEDEPDPPPLETPPDPEPDPEIIPDPIPAPTYEPPVAPASQVPIVHAAAMSDQVPESGPEIYFLLILSLILGGGYYKIKQRI